MDARDSTKKTCATCAEGPRAVNIGHPPTFSGNETETARDTVSINQRLLIKAILFSIKTHSFSFAHIPRAGLKNLRSRSYIYPLLILSRFFFFAFIISLHSSCYFSGLFFPRAYICTPECWILARLFKRVVRDFFFVLFFETADGVKHGRQRHVSVRHGGFPRSFVSFGDAEMICQPGSSVARRRSYGGSVREKIRRRNLDTNVPPNSYFMHRSERS